MLTNEQKIISARQKEASMMAVANALELTGWSDSEGKESRL